MSAVRAKINVMQMQEDTLELGSRTRPSAGDLLDDLRARGIVYDPEDGWWRGEERSVRALGDVVLRLEPDA